MTAELRSATGTIESTWAKTAARPATSAGVCAFLLALALPVAAQEQSPQVVITQPGGGSQAETRDQGQSANAARPGAQNAQAQADCSALPSHQTLTQALRHAVEPDDKDANGGLGNHMWAVVVDRSGAICGVAYSGNEMDQQWPGSRAIAAEKAFTANGFSLPNFALSTANLYWPSQPTNSLYGAEAGNPVNPEPLYLGPASNWGTENDPLIGRRIGGTIVFGGGLALYNPEGDLIGGLGLSGDQSCTDHVIAWKLRHSLNLDNVPAGVTEAENDNIIFDLTDDPATGRQTSPSGYGHPSCGPAADRIAENFDENFPTGPEE